MIDDVLVYRARRIFHIVCVLLGPVASLFLIHYNFKYWKCQDIYSFNLRLDTITICDNIIHAIKCNHAFYIAINYNYNSKFTYIYFNDIISSDVFYHVLRNGH